MTDIEQPNIAEEREFYGEWLGQALMGRDAPMSNAKYILCTLGTLTEDATFMQLCKFEGYDVSSLQAVRAAAEVRKREAIAETAADLQTTIFENKLFDRVELVGQTGAVAVSGVIAGEDKIVPVQGEAPLSIDDFSHVRFVVGQQTEEREL